MAAPTAISDLVPAVGSTASTIKPREEPVFRGRPIQILNVDVNFIDVSHLFTTQFSDPKLIPSVNIVV